MLSDGLTCSHMEDKLSYWNEDSIRAEAIKYKTKAAFRKGSPKAYDAAKKRGILNDESVFGHMEVFCIHWDKVSIRTEALKFNTKVAFKTGSPKAYDAACTRGLLNDESIVGHMEAQKVYWNEYSIRTDALNFNTLAEFQKQSSGYQAARLRNMIDDGVTCAHMDQGMSGFKTNKPAILYYIKFYIANELPLYKIGITNRTVEDRLQGLNANNGFIATIIKEIWFENGAEALDLEKQLHQEFKEHRYLGDAILRNGNTELFVTDVLNYDVKQQAA